MSYKAYMDLLLKPIENPTRAQLEEIGFYPIRIHFKSIEGESIRKFSGCITDVCNYTILFMADMKVPTMAISIKDIVKIEGLT